MKLIKWKSLIMTCGVCLFSILYGVILWNSLPESVPIHFDIYNQPDNFAPKAVAVFVLPMLMIFLQIICCIINDVNAARYGERKKFERATKWIIPVLTNILQIVTLIYAIGWDLDIRRIVCVVVGVMLIVMGNYMPKLDYIKNKKCDEEKARKINRFIGYETVVMGILFIISSFLPPAASVVCLFLLIPYAIISIIYGIK